MSCAATSAIASWREQVGEREVVTAWLGLDHGFGHTPEPLIFGTVAVQHPHEESTLHQVHVGRRTKTLTNAQQVTVNQLTYADLLTRTTSGGAELSPTSAAPYS